MCVVSQFVIALVALQAQGKLCAQHGAPPLPLQLCCAGKLSLLSVGVGEKRCGKHYFLGRNWCVKL